VKCDLCKIFLPPEKYTKKGLSGDKKSPVWRGASRAGQKTSSALCEKPENEGGRGMSPLPHHAF